MLLTNTFSVNFIIRFNKKNKSVALIYARIMVNGEIKEISLKENIKSVEWDGAREMVKGKSPQAKATNKYIEDVRFRLKEKYRMLEGKNYLVTALAVKEAFLGIHKSQNSSHKLIELFDYHYEIFKGDLADGTMKNYITTKEYVERFLQANFKTNDILLRDLDYQFIIELKSYIRDNPIKEHDPCQGNGLMKHLERVKKLSHWATKLKWLHTDPFEDFELNFTKYKRERLDIQELQKIVTKKFHDKNLSLIRDLFLFSCYTGLTYGNVITLTKESICTYSNDQVMLKIYRVKGGQLATIPMLKPALELIEKYENGAKAEARATVFPYISNQEVNRSLKLIQEICEIKKNLTFHLARHTFATLVTLKNGVPIETISKMLGHTKISTTRIYAEVDDEKIMGDMQAVQKKWSTRF